jgi:hypothetical protein
MTSDEIDINNLKEEFRGQSLSLTLEEIAAEGAAQIVIAVHPGSNLSNSTAPEPEKKSYKVNTRNYLDWCRKNNIKIVHFRNMWNISDTEIEPVLGEAFGVEADYEVATMLNMGIPIDLMPQYMEQMSIYGIFRPNFYYKGDKIQVVNGIGGFTEITRCFPEAVAIMEIIAAQSVRLISDCLISKTGKPIDLKSYFDMYDLSPDKVGLYSLKDPLVTEKVA